MPVNNAGLQPLKLYFYAKFIFHEKNYGSTFDVIDIPDDLKEETKKYRSQLIEAVAEYDEALFEKFFDDPDSITEDEIHNALRSATQDMSIIPMICGSSFKNKGVQPLLDAVINGVESVCLGSAWYIVAVTINHIKLSFIKLKAFLPDK